MSRSVLFTALLAIAESNNLALPFTITALEDQLIHLDAGMSPLVLLNLYYKLNNSSWIYWLHCYMDAISLKSGDILKLKGTTSDFNIYDLLLEYLDDKQNWFNNGGKKVNISGNLMSLVNWNKLLGSSKSIFGGIFSNIKIIDASLLLLPLMNITAHCYLLMFLGQNQMINGPKILPAIDLQNYCYLSMFEGCTNLVKSPIIFGLFLTDTSCINMFKNCTSLSEITTYFCLWKGTTNWVLNVSNTGIVNKIHDLENIYDSSHIPTGWNISSLYYTLPFNETLILLLFECEQDKIEIIN